MSTITNPAELRRRGFEILVRELGYLNAVKFLLQFETGTGDYSRDRDQLIPSWSLEEMIRRSDELVRAKSREKTD